MNVVISILHCTYWLQLLPANEAAHTLYWCPLKTRITKWHQKRLASFLLPLSFVSSDFPAWNQFMAHVASHHSCYTFPRTVLWVITEEVLLVSGGFRSDSQKQIYCFHSVAEVMADTDKVFGYRIKKTTKGDCDRARVNASFELNKWSRMEFERILYRGTRRSWFLIGWPVPGWWCPSICAWF